MAGTNRTSWKKGQSGNPGGRPNAAQAFAKTAALVLRNAPSLSGVRPDGRSAAGSPRKDVEARYLMALSKLVTLDDWEQIALRAVTDAKKGDVTARAWLSKHLLGDTTLDMLVGACVAEMEYDISRGDNEELIIAAANLRLGAESMSHRKSKYEEKYSVEVIRKAAIAVLGPRVEPDGHEALSELAGYGADRRRSGAGASVDCAPAGKQSRRERRGEARGNDP